MIAWSSLASDMFVWACDWMVWEKELSSRSQPSLVPRELFYKGKGKRKNNKLRFETLNIIFNDFKPQKWIPGWILMLLDPHNLSVRQKLLIKYIAIFAILLCHLSFLASLKITDFDIQTSYGGLKVSGFNQEFISEV